MSGLTELSYFEISLAVFAQQFCLPLPSLLLLLTAGALVGQGQGHLKIPLILAAGMVGCLAADSFWFWLGRRWGSGVIRLLCSLTADPRRSRERSRRIFGRWGLRLLLVAKFVPVLDGVSPPLAGAEGASVGGFLLFDVIGSFVWLSVYVTLGFLFSSQLDAVIRLVERFSATLALVIGVPLFVYVAWTLQRLIRMIRHLRLRRISPALLQQKLDAGDRVAVVDLLYFEAVGTNMAGIPGAFRADPQKLRRRKRIIVPDGVEIVLYCSSKNEFTSARVAETMHKLGVADVWVLEGGLDAWVAEGHPVTMELASGEAVAARLGIQLVGP